MAVFNTLPQANNYYTSLSIGPYKRDKAFGFSEFDPKFIVHLPLPTELRDDTTVSYSAVNLETVGDFLDPEKNKGLGEAAALRNIGSLAQQGISATSSGIGQLTNGRGPLARLAGGALGGLMSALQSLVPAEQISSAIQQKTGAAPNPNPSVQFQGPVLRDFTLSWAFYPRNLSESKKIDSLIRKLKARALPSNNLDNGGAVLNYPHICQLNFFPWDNGSLTHPNGWSKDSIIQIKKCFMSGVNVNYNAFGTPAFFEGTHLPISYQLTINFKEIEYLLAGDWDPDKIKGADGKLKSLVEGERNLVTERVQVPNVIGEGASIAFGVAGTVGREFLEAGVETFFDNIPDSTDLDNIGAVAVALKTLKSPDKDGKGGTIVTIDAPTPAIFGDDFNPLNNRRAGLVTLTKNAEGKFVVVLQPNSFTEVKSGFKTEYPPETLGTFDTEEARDEFLLKQSISNKGKVTFPLPPKPAAAAPE